MEAHVALIRRRGAKPQHVDETNAGLPMDECVEWVHWKHLITQRHCAVISFPCSKYAFLHDSRAGGENLRVPAGYGEARNILEQRLVNEFFVTGALVEPEEY